MAGPSDAILLLNYCFNTIEANDNHIMKQSYQMDRDDSNLVGGESCCGSLLMQTAILA
jgi:hypothetical protein